MLLGFSQQFPDGRLTHFRRKIERGIKIHTIREDPHRRWRAGRIIQMSHGVRTKNYSCFRQAICTGTQRITLNWLFSSYRYWYDIHVDGRLLDKREVLQLAVNDGFESIEAFVSFFPAHFDGCIIHWTLYRY
jgi:hypothetical protein